MKAYFNLYYLVVIGIGCLLWKFNASLGKEVVSFYGFAENKETEINFNYPVSVGELKVQPGEFVKANTPLLDVYRIKAREEMDDEFFRKAELEAKQTIWKTDKENEYQKLRAEYSLEEEKLVMAIQKLEEQKMHNESIYKNLKSLSSDAATYTPVTDKINALRRELTLVRASYKEQLSAIQKELAVGKNPYKIATERLDAEQKFEEASRRQLVQIFAPTDGIVGNILCKEAEYIASHTTLLTFYEPNPTIVKGFVQEDLSLHVSLKDEFIIRSTKDPTISCRGEVIGLGSRILEIPERLRKMRDFKTYGREVLVSIAPSNHFLQKEKVILEFVNTPKYVRNATPSKALVALKKAELNEK